ncbi:hypothetical protein SteCoe_27048 [Stentor coeruleus]|uniref:Kinesin-like protein n=1 Tax=Stentor coeruleus TaxID=5963 RepID=A0A1R2BBD2_9CILI|nr:hypothetical protein SteCoe_27048 [Stentor coeruleus]
MANYKNGETNLDDVLQEYNEFKAQSKEYEEFLEADIQEKDNKIEDLLNTIEKLKDDNSELRKKYEKDEMEISKLLNEVDIIKKKLKWYEEQKRDLEVLNDQWERSARVLEYSKQELEERLTQAEEIAIIYKEEIEELSINKEIEMQRLKDQCNELKQELSIVTVEKADLNRTFNKNKVEIVTLNEGISIPPKPKSRNHSKSSSKIPSRGHSRKNSNESNDCSQSVKVVVRVRPPLKAENWDKNALNISQNTICVKESKNKNTDSKTFEFENIVFPDQNEDALFAQIKESVSHVAYGKNACVMAYGQTGSGKTYTMNSIIHKAVDKLRIIENAEVTIQCLEVYNEQVKNLILTDQNIKNPKDPMEGSEIKLKVDWAEQALEIINEAISRRTTKFTDCNERSSRSHAIYTLNFYTNDYHSKIQFVDLAGSERVGKSNVSGETLKEALLINKSLSALQDVISALENKQKHVPYRNSMLTKLLQPTLGGSQSAVNMIFNCSPSNESLNETVCTLALASRVKAVDLGFFIRKNLKTKEVERTLSLLEKERLEKNNILRTLDKLQRDLESYQFAVKDRDNKIAMLNSKIKLRDKAYQEVKTTKPKIEITKTMDSPNSTNSLLNKAKLRSAMNKSKNKNLLCLNIKDIGRVVSLSPSNPMLKTVGSTLKPTRIPTPSFTCLRLNQCF